MVLLVKLYLGRVLVHFIVLSMNLGHTRKSIALICVISLYENEIMYYKYMEYHWVGSWVLIRESLWFMPSFYCKQRFHVTGIAACLLLCFAVIWNFYFSLLDTLFPSIKVKYILKSPCSSVSSDLLGKLYNLPQWAREKAGNSSRNLNSARQSGSVFHTHCPSGFCSNSGLPIIIKL